MKHQKPSEFSFKREAPTASEPGNICKRALTVRTLASLQRRSAGDIAGEMYPNDRALMQLVTRAASNPAMTSVAGWAAELAAKKVADVVSTLGTAAAAVRIMGDGLLLDWDRYGTLYVPAFVATATSASFVQESNPIPVRQFTETASALLPYIVAGISALTREMMESSNAEALISDVLSRSSALAIDGAFFDSNPANQTRPAGIRSGIAALTASSSTDPFGAVFEDVSALLNSVGAVGGSGPFYLVGSAGKMASMKGRFDFEGTGDTRMVPVVSSAVGNDLLAIAPTAIAAAVSADPEIEVVDAGVLVMDTAPGAAGTMGPERSLFQTDTLAIKCRWPVSWILRDPRGVAWLTPGWK